MTPLSHEGMKDDQRAKAYSSLKRRLWLMDLILTTGFLVIFGTSGVAKACEGWVREGISGWPLQTAVYLSLLGGALAVFTFPLDFYRQFVVEHRFGLSPQRFCPWLREYGKHLALGGLFILLLVEGVVALIRMDPHRWWAWAAFLWVLWSILLARVAPTLLLPIFYRQRSLSNESLRNRLESLLARCGARVRGIFEVDLSRTTRKANACLCGLGKTRRVLLSDTLVSRYSPEEVEVILAHELGHHLKQHMGILIGVGSVAAIASFLLVDRVLHFGLKFLELTSLKELAALPWMALGLLWANLLFLPVLNGISRALEAQADRFSLKATRNPQAFIAAMKHLAEQNLAEVSPPRWVEWLFHDHPSIARRIALAQKYSG